MWTALPQAATLLADCRRRPPQRDHRTSTFEQPRPYYRADDPRLRKLRSIYRAAEPDAWTPEWSAWLRLDPQAAVREAVEAAEQQVAA